MMTPKSAISIILLSALLLLAFCTVVFNREMTTMIESSPLAQYEVLPLEAEAFSASMDAAGVNSAVDGIRELLKQSLGMSDA